MICKICGSEFKPRRPNQIYCSATCRTQAGTTKWWTERKEKRSPATCPTCGKEFDPRKKVTQATKDGQVVAVYESTAEAERQTGLKQRGIQKAARGEAKSYAGFVWTYA